MTRNRFDITDYVDISDIPYDDILDEIGEDYIRDWLAVRDIEGEVGMVDMLSNPIKRLDVIVALRKLGYTVESA